jgi:hypothetical protein
MQVGWGQVAPVIISIGIILLIALLRAMSKTLAAVTATMPINIMLALWIVYAVDRGEKTAVIEFTGSMVIGVLATLACVVGMWLAARAGWRLVPIIAAGYLAWGTVLLVNLGIGQLLGGR